MLLFIVVVFLHDAFDHRAINAIVLKLLPQRGNILWQTMSTITSIVGIDEGMALAYTRIGHPNFPCLLIINSKLFAKVIYLIHKGYFCGEKRVLHVFCHLRFGLPNLMDFNIRSHDGLISLHR